MRVASCESQKPDGCGGKVFCRSGRSTAIRHFSHASAYRGGTAAPTKTLSLIEQHYSLISGWATGVQDIGRLIAAVALYRPLANGFEVPIDQGFTITEHLDQLVLFTIYTLNTFTVQGIGAYRLDALVSAY